MGKLNWAKRACVVVSLCSTTAIALPAQTLTTLHTFDSTDGVGPLAGLVQATDGNLYGATQLGGSDDNGTAFKIAPNGTMTTLHTFCSQGNCTDGADVVAGLAQATNGDLYGTAGVGGALGFGTVFKMTLSGTLTTLHSFDGADGASPYSGLVQGTNGNLYGTTNGDGVRSHGTVFKMTLSGTLTTLYRFCSKSDCTDGDGPQATLVQATDGNFYGTTVGGGANGYGTVFKITPSGASTTVYSFCSQSDCTDGQYPYAALVQDTSGKFYGTTQHGGASSDGTVFTLSVGLGPFVKTLPTSGNVGAAVKILGTSLTAPTSVTFNGTPATFTVESGSHIKTTVPPGATTGRVQVVTPNGKLSSNLPFRVTP